MAKATPTMRQLRYFKELANYKNFTTAAKALNTTQSTISSAIRQLEYDLDANLFDRSTHHVHLTDQGIAIKEHVERMVNSHYNGMRELLKLTRYRSKTIRVTCIPSAIHLITPWISLWLERNPNIEVEIKDMHNGLVTNAIALCNADIGIDTGHIPPDILISHCIAQDEMMIVFPTNHLLAEETYIEDSELKNYKISVLNSDYVNKFLENYLVTQKIPSPQIYIFNDIETIYSLIIHEHSFGLIFRSQIKSYLPHTLTARPIDTRPISREISLIASKNLIHNDLELADFWNFLKENL